MTHKEFLAKAVAFALALVLGLIAVTTTEAAPAPLARLMVEVINPAANTLFGARIMNAMSDKDWDDVRQAVAALNTASMTVAAGGSMPGEPDLAKVAKWPEWSARFTATVQAAKRAGDRKDRQALIAASNTLVGVCEGCHMAVAVVTP